MLSQKRMCLINKPNTEVTLNKSKGVTTKGCNHFLWDRTSLVFRQHVGFTSCYPFPIPRFFSGKLDEQG